MAGDSNTGIYEIVGNRSGIILIMILAFAVTFLDGLDSSIVVFSLPSISEEFAVSPSSASWITNAYLIGIAAPLIAFTKLADRGKTREMFVYGTLIFTVSSLLCSLNFITFEMFIVLRLIQGIGASMMGAAAPIMIVRMLAPNIRARGMSVLAMASGVSLVIGPSVGSALTTFIGWRSIFLVNIPLGIIIILVGFKYIQRPKVKANFHLDLHSVVYSILFITFTLISLQNIVNNILPLWLAIIFGVCAVLFLALGIIRMRNDKVIDHILDAKLFRNPEFILVSVSFFMTTMVSVGPEYMLPFFFEISCGFDSIKSGLLLTIISLFTIVATLFAGKWCDTKGCKIPAATAIVLRIAFSSIFLFMVPEWGLAPFIIVLAIMGLSFGISGTSQPARIIQHADKDCKGDASAILAEMNYIGASFGMIVFSMIFTLVSFQHPEIMSDSPIVITESLHIGGLVGILLSVGALICTLYVRNILPGKEDE